MSIRIIAVAILTFCFGARAADSRDARIAPQPETQQAIRYYWKSIPVGDSAELVTLLCDSCGTAVQHEEGVPLVSVLRDTLDSRDSKTDRITYVWLLSLTHQNAGQQLLAAVPFFYWRIGDGSTHIDENHPVRPLMDLTKPEEPMVVQVMRDVLQWTVLDPLSMPVRASSRAYSTNDIAHERAHLEEAIGYLRRAPKGESGEGLTTAEADTVIARLALRESLLGGLVGEHQAEHVGERKLAEEETVRSRNWDLLRGFAEKTGLYFEPLDVAGASGEYGVLWFPDELGAAEPVNSSHAEVWKALNLPDPWTDARLQNWDGPVFERSVDENGILLPAGVPGSHSIKLIPLGAYSLTYPKSPLLMIDFRDKLHVRRNEMTQRTVNELTSGIIGISHFTNWYYYAGASAYDFVASRHGRAMDAALRLDAYSRFRSALALDGSIQPDLRRLLQRRIDSVALNPLDGSPGHDLQVANAHYAALLHEVSTGLLARSLQTTRESELANFGKTPQVLASQAFLRATSVGLFSARYQADADLVPELIRVRRVEADLDLLHSAADSGSRPEIAFQPVRLRAAVQELSELIPGVLPKNVRADAATTLKRIGSMTQDSELRADCSLGLMSLRDSDVPGISVSMKVVQSALRFSDTGR